MGIVNHEFLASANGRVYGCRKCKTHLSTTDAVMSKQFTGQHGRAYLFESVVNIGLGDPDDRHMRTGLHTVRDVYCIKCQTVVGWKYDHAFVQSEKYKEGKFILEKLLLVEVQ
ncbi:hypothetical protein CF319_g787 [Tilletia indica]|uniref:Protein yippee-like n=2 Tax=Tilletia TaxID=13289 RepID=A0A8X7NCG1_9BASI|nr:hypothetical protein CF327_g1505 [Tilletia walkeri]KAE8224581.1 hypothetical protein CF326_g8009 [Tilletia indica]KAE8226623.1 hypothetical protein CF319_g787 [Tilletia indica]KAE8251891.1 hypothetical protein A4X13_0g3802 [Tilletia indica]KAE8270488.1 hypothetical protein A4X09_0g1841 [Tilletia walkeri]